MSARSASAPQDPSDDRLRARWRSKSSPPRRHLSEVLADIAGDETIDAISTGDLLHLMEGRARAALVFLFAFPNVLPAPPGLSAILGLPLLYLTFQMMLGRLPWLPAFVANRSIARTAFAATVERFNPILHRIERMLKPRLAFAVSHTAEKPLGALALVLAMIVTLPIPLGNMLPAFAVCLIALAVLERDGLCAVVGAIIGCAAIALSATVVYAMAKAAVFLLFNAFS